MGISQSDSTASSSRFVSALDTVRRSPANLILLIGVVLFVTGALVLRVGVWAAILGVWGLALVLLGTSIRTAIWWIRR